MKRRYSSDSSDETAIDMTPMLDIVFIMLIFFIVTTSFVKEAGIEVNRPTASSAQTVKKGNIMVAVEAAGDEGLINDALKSTPFAPTSSVFAQKALMVRLLSRRIQKPTQA